MSLVAKDWDGDARLDFSDEVTPFEVAHAAVQADVVDGVVVALGQDPLIRVVGSGEGGGPPFSLVSFFVSLLGRGKQGAPYSLWVSMTRWTMGMGAPGTL
jgi:hypothetical protein